MLVTKLRTYPSSVDPRDYIYEQSLARLKESVDLREWDSPVDDQYQLGSCVGNAVASAYEHQVKRLYPEKFEELSRLFIYYNARTIYGETSEDTGTTIRAALKGVRQYGICSEKTWPYVLWQYDDKPSDEAYAEAKARNIINYCKLPTEMDTMDSLVNGKPVVVALTIFSEFMNLTKENSVIPLPKNTSQEFGGHAMCIVGYDISRALFLAKNSFGTDWGDNGYCWIPFLYAKKYIFEQWAFDITDQTPVLLT